VGGPHLGKRQARGGPAAYRSSMCSISRDPSPEPGELDRLGRAIDELAAAQGQDASAPDIAARVARLWDMVAELDPELARRLAGYGP
jgi:hypothetical protein